jgi:hypothetical protein
MVCPPGHVPTSHTTALAATELLRTAHQVEPAVVGVLDVTLRGEQIVPGAVDPCLIDLLAPRFGGRLLREDIGVVGVVVSLAFDQPVLTLLVEHDEVSEVPTTSPLDPGRPVGVEANPPLDMGRSTVDQAAEAELSAASVKRGDRLDIALPAAIPLPLDEVVPPAEHRLGHRHRRDP